MPRRAEGHPLPRHRRVRPSVEIRADERIRIHQLRGLRQMARERADAHELRLPTAPQSYPSFASRTPVLAPATVPRHNAPVERAPVIALIDGEHHPAAVR